MQMRSSSGVKTSNEILIVIAALGALVSVRARADPWLPPAGTGKVKAVVRSYHADRTFSASGWGSETFPSKTRYRENSLKVTGLHGLGDGWALQVDLRAASVRKTKQKKNVETTQSASGLQDQLIGLVRGLRQGEGFADAVALNAVFPIGSTSSTPQLGVGHFAIEPQYLFGIRHRFGSRTAYGSFSVGPRLYLAGHVAQWRATARAGIILVPKVDLFGTLFYARTRTRNAAVATVDPNASEVYNLLRGGVGFQFAISKSVRPTIAYETDLAGRDIHAGRRIVAGLSWRY